MEVYRFLVRDEWEEVLACSANGDVLRGSLDALEAAQIAGRELKVAIAGLAADLGEDEADGPDGPAHEVFSSVGSGFFHTRARLYTCSTHPLVRVAPAAPLRDRSFGWGVPGGFLRSAG